MKPKQWVVAIFFSLVVLTLLTPFWVFKDLLFPYITSKAFYLRILVELTLPVYLYLILSYKSYRPSFKNPLTISVVAFLLLNVVSAFFGVNPLRSFWGNFERMGGVFYIAHLTLFYFYIVLLGQISSNYLRRFIVAVVSIAGFIGVYSVMVKITANHFFLADPSYPRVSATFGNPIFLASFLIIPMFLTLYYLVGEERRWMQGVYGVLVLLQLYCILLSETRGAVVGLAGALFICAVVYVFMTPRKKLRLWGGGIIAAFVLLVGLAFTFHNAFPPTSMFHRVFNLKDSNTEARIIQWGVALKGYKDHPLLGVGSENYYVLSNKYYNPAIFQYDPSWFDKPHNYLIEVLVTSGALGFAAYLGILVFFIWILYQSYKKEFLSLMEFCLLLAGFLSYEFQNLTVFDTIGASLMFFSFVGFGGFLWYSYNKPLKEEKKKQEAGLSPLFVNAAVAVCALLAIYVVYVGNVFGIRIAKDVNYGYAYASVDPQIAKDYFENARNLPFDFDPVQFASKYGDFATNLAASPGKQTADFVNANLKDAIAVEQDAVTQVPNDPTAWSELANLYLTQAIVNKTTLDPKAMQAAQKAIDLAPKRPEPASMMARLYLSQNNIPEAEKIIQQITTTIPEDRDAKLQLALMYSYDNKPDQALQLAQNVIATGYVPQQASEIDWMAPAYEKKGDIQSAINIYKMALQIQPNSLPDMWGLAQDFAKVGQKEQAIAIAQQLIQVDSADASHFQDFINSLK